MSQPVENGVVLPLELCDRIIDELAGDTRALLACSSVSRSFYPRTRFLIFGTFRVNPVPQRNLGLLVDCWGQVPHIPAYIHTFHFSTVFLTEPQAASMLRYMRNVKTVFMNHVYIHHFRNREAIEALAALPIETLTINGSDFTSINAFAFAMRCFPRLISLNLFGASISSAADTEFPWVNNLDVCGPPRIENLTVTARSVETRKSNTRLFSEFPFNNQPFRIDNLNMFEVRCANQTDIVRIGRFLPHIPRTLRKLGITRVDNGVSTPGVPLPWVLGVHPLALQSTEHLIIDVGLRVGNYADYLRWWISSIAAARDVRSISIRIAMAFTYLDKAENKPWQNVWQMIDSALSGKESLEQVVVELQIPSCPRNFLGRKRGIESECRDLIERGIMRVVLPKKVRLEAF
ncbi:uncharacterized protein EV420DRAFT_1129170 [Desarmillaria tabescens]|uniref:F-box domain-containing protein n=1 Tax=Armillaria tabescens TaxID=1929756 RepID=A0AA39JDP1_ARMTA|nr:uncharacterized protein EV420DRAFT_1129170 [Desarmillaria tabescens]KAK0440872.1 hypothetical protein EV420DRAFT_1129170 [Desarmillaria tabescens]